MENAKIVMICDIDIASDAIEISHLEERIVGMN